MTTPPTPEQVNAVLREFAGGSRGLTDALAVAVVEARATIARLEGEKRNLALKLQQVDEELAVDGHYNTVEKAILVRAQANRADAAERGVEAVTQALEYAVRVFDAYAEIHQAKGTQEASVKAQANAGHAEFLRAALAAASGAKEGR